DFVLYQNYPNPFNPATTITFALPQAAHMNLEIFNLQGRRITILLNENLPAGRHQIQWNAEGLPTGVYFCRMRAGNFSEMKKMVVLR
ncbi:MAG: T9SS type A sorting domain-containing protein, partial [Calditrichia bacterium]